MRFKESQEQKTHLQIATKDGSIELVYAGLDALGETPWKINRGIFDIVLQIWNSGERMGKIPPADYDEPEPILKPQSTIHEKSIHIMQHKAWAQRKAANHSERCSVNYKIEIARAVGYFRFCDEPLPIMLNFLRSCSSWVIPYICPTTWTSAAVHTPYHLT